MRRLAPLLALLFIASPSEVAGQDGMPLDESLTVIRNALNQLASERPTEPGTLHGLVPAEVEIVLQVGAVHTEDGGWSFNIFGVGASSEGSPDQVHTTNTITIRFRNVAFAQNNELISTPGSLAPAIDEIWQLPSTMMPSPSANPQ